MPINSFKKRCCRKCVFSQQETTEYLCPAIIQHHIHLGSFVTTSVVKEVTNTKPFFMNVWWYPWILLGEAWWMLKGVRGGQIVEGQFVWDSWEERAVHKAFLMGTSWPSIKQRPGWEYLCLLWTFKGGGLLFIMLNFPKRFKKKQNKFLPYWVHWISLSYSLDFLSVRDLLM